MALKISSEDAATILTDINRLLADMLVQKFAHDPLELKIAEIAVRAAEDIIDTYINKEISEFNARSSI